MAFTPKARVWSPDGSEKASFRSLLATMASSIENGIGKRLGLQEVAIGLKASVINSWNIPTSPTVVPYTNNGSYNGDFTQGITIVNGVVTIATPGMYLVTASAGVTNSVTGRGTRLVIQKNGNNVSSLETAQVAPIYSGICASVVTNCVAGDTFRALANISGSSPAPMASNNEGTNISVVMVQALPV